MAEKEKSKAEFVELDYTGKEKGGQVFDTTIEAEAKKAGLNTDGMKYRPVIMIAGEGLLIKGFEKAIASMKEGETKDVEITPEDGYGPRDPRLMQIVPLSVFQKNKVNPVPGMMINSENGPMRIVSVSGGRVQVDFNHQLAGKTLEFKIKLHKRLVKEEDRIHALIQMVFGEGKASIKLKDKELTVVLPAAALKMPDLQPRKIAFVKQIKKYTSVDKVTVNEEY